MGAVCQGIADYYAASTRALGKGCCCCCPGSHRPCPDCCCTPLAPPRILLLLPSADIQVRLLLSIDRRQTAEQAMDTARLAVRLHREGDSGVVGLDLSGNPSVGQVGGGRPQALG